MVRMVSCVKLGKEAEGLDAPPYPGELGKRLFENVSKEAWQMWMRQQTMLINENRLSMVDPRAQKLLREEMERFLFGEGSAPPAGYVPPST
jgi:Fe-S cluster biosynthesis and repair protein YggX